MISTRRITAFSALALLAGATAGCASGTPEAAVADVSGWKVLSGEAFLTGIGVPAPGTEQPQADTRPRAPLVIPADRRSLPPPSAASAAAANWPNDPDAARVAAEGRDPGYLARLARGDTRLTEAQMRAGAASPGPAPVRTARRDPTRADPSRPNDNGWISPDQLGRQAQVAREIARRERAAAGPEASLLTPPEGHLVVPVPEAEVPERNVFKRLFGRKES
jgi:hypothetical protein